VCVRYHEVKALSRVLPRDGARWVPSGLRGVGEAVYVNLLLIQGGEDLTLGNT